MSTHRGEIGENNKEKARYRAFLLSEKRRRVSGGDRRG
jgi:hypothetical protein